MAASASLKEIDQGTKLHEAKRLLRGIFAVQRSPKNTKEEKKNQIATEVSKIRQLLKGDDSFQAQNILRSANGYLAEDE